MAGFEGRVRAVSETRSRPVTASNRLVLCSLRWLSASHWLARGFELGRNHREFHDETYSTGPLASPLGGMVLLAVGLDSPSAATALDFVRREQRGHAAVGCPAKPLRE